MDKSIGNEKESDAFKISKEEPTLYESKSIGQVVNQGENSSKLDYTKIKQEFLNAGKEFPLKEEECTGLSMDEKMEINPCGTYCGNCEDYGVVCDGCRNRNGKPIWYHIFSKEESCSYYKCTKEKKFHDCSQCQQMPCGLFFEYPDPNMSDEFKQMWFQLRMGNFNKINCLKKIDVEDTYQENIKKFNK